MFEILNKNNIKFSKDIVLQNLVEFEDFFEGTEKLLEIWFIKNLAKNNDKNIEKLKTLRSIPQSCLNDILKNVKAKIISCKSSSYWDAYVLSESSLFISDDRIILKTCGTTTLLLGLESILKNALEWGNVVVQKLFYSRKSMIHPEKQLFPHFDFDSETKYLKNMFPMGQSLIFGNEKSFENNQWVTFVYEDFKKNFNNKNILLNDTTFELLMNNLEFTCALKFYKQSTNNFNSLLLDINQNNKSIINQNNLLNVKNSMLYNSGLDKCFNHETIIDALEFEPFGFSMNALNKDIYHTIHVTPQIGCSYASYETNLLPKLAFNHCRGILNVFKPETFVINIFTTNNLNNVIECFTNFDQNYKLETIESVNLTDHIVFYAYYKKL